jgi:5'-3' exoribonuclease Xrn1-like protein
MGIHQFYRWLKKHGADMILQDQLPSYISSLMMDSNGIIYQTMAEVYGIYEEEKRYDTQEDKERRRRGEVRTKYLKREADHYANIGNDAFNNFLDDLELEHFNAIGAKLLKIIHEVAPQDLLIISLDGPAPIAKLKQQRSRRFRSGKKMDHSTRKFHGTSIYENGIVVDYEIDGEAPYSWPLFDGTAITPGTDFMFNLDEFLRKWIVKQSGTIPPTTIYYSHLMPGEGEHRIMDFIRSGELDKYEGTHIIWGADSDLAILGLIAPIRNLYIARDSSTDIINIGYLREMIEQRMTEGTPNEMNRNQGREQEREQGREQEREQKLINVVLNDFVFLFSLVGNDFLPRQPGMRMFWESIDQLIDLYVQMNEREAHHLTKRDDNIVSVNWKIVYQFLQKIAHIEERLLTDIANDERRHPWAILDRSIVRTQTASRPGVAGHSENTFDFKTFRLGWYANALIPHNYAQLSDLDKELLGPNALRIDTEIGNMVKSYLQGLGWINTYYNGGAGAVDLGWFYPWEHAPLLTDLVINMRKLSHIPSYGNREGQTPINAVYQLMVVLPPSAAYLVPESVEKLMNADSPIADVYPTDFKLDDNGTIINSGTDAAIKAWMAIPLLPPFRPELVIETIQSNIVFSEETRNRYKEVSAYIQVRSKEVTEAIRKTEEFNRFKRQELSRTGYQRRGGRTDRGGYQRHGGRTDRGGGRTDRGGYQRREGRTDKGGYSRGGGRTGRGGYQRREGRTGRGGYQRREGRTDRGGYSRGGGRTDRGGYQRRETGRKNKEDRATISAAEAMNRSVIGPGGSVHTRVDTISRPSASVSRPRVARGFMSVVKSHRPNSRQVLPSNQRIGSSPGTIRDTRQGNRLTESQNTVNREQSVLSRTTSEIGTVRPSERIPSGSVEVSKSNLLM